MTESKVSEEQHKKAQHIQQKYMEYQMLEQQLKQLQQQIEKLQEQKGEAQQVEQGIDDFEQAKPGDEILVPISGGIFFKTTLNESDKFLVNVGSGVVVEKNLKGVKKLINQQVDDITKYNDAMMTELTKMAIRHSSLEEELKKLVED